MNVCYNSCYVNTLIDSIGALANKPYNEWFDTPPIRVLFSPYITFELTSLYAIMFRIYASRNIR
jgi:hypothetical protein